jgi:uncharacterized protein (TIGR00369 family)
MTVHEDLMKQMLHYKEQFGAMGIKLSLPPLSMIELKLEYTKVEPGTLLAAKFPFQKRFTNPVGLMQGGFLAAAIDDIFGPLSYMTAQRPCMTLSMNITYLRAFSEKDQEVHLEGRVIQKTKNFIFMRVEVKNPQGDIVATADSQVKA